MATPMSDERLAKFKAEYPSDDIRSRCSPEHWRMHELIDEVDRLRACVARLEALLRRVEWQGRSEWDYGYAFCPECQSPENDNHAPDCELAAVLRGAG